MKLLHLSPAIFLTVCSCASIVSHSTWPVSISSNPPGAKITITNDKNGKPIHVGETPATISLKSGAGFFTTARYRIEYSKPGYVPATSYLSSTLNGWYLGNILFGGLIGILIVDPATGAMYRLPSEHFATLTPLKSTNSYSDPTGKNLYVVSIESVPLHLRHKLERVN
jgi:hypothetical protein